MRVVTVDIPADMNQVDETGLVWTFMTEARDMSIVFPGAIVSTGDDEEPAVAEVIDIVEEPAGKIVHLQVLPGHFEDYQALVRRCIS